MEVYRKIGGQYQVNGGTLEVNGKNAVRPAVLVETENLSGFSHRSAGSVDGSADRCAGTEYHTGKYF